MTRARALKAAASVAVALLVWGLVAEGQAVARYIFPRIVLLARPVSATCWPPGELAYNSNFVTGAATICDQLGRPRPLGGPELITGETSPSNAGNQGPDRGVAFGFTPPTTVTIADTLRMVAIVNKSGTCSGACAALPAGQQVAVLTLSQHLSDGGFSEYCRNVIPCITPVFIPDAGAGTYTANCSGSVQIGTPGVIMYADAGCSANPYAKYALIYDLRTSN